MKEIKLTKGQVALVDNEDFEYLNQWKWYARKSRHTYYAERRISKSEGYFIVQMHRIILNTPDNLEVDHRNHNGLDNQKYNLRNCTHLQNQHNQSASGRSQFLGVGYNGNYIRAYIGVNGKSIHLGYFKTETEAAFAYNERAKELFGEFANLNII